MLYATTSINLKSSVLSEKKLDSKGYTLYQPIYRKRLNYRKINQISVARGSSESKGIDYIK